MVASCLASATEATVSVAASDSENTTAASGVGEPSSGEAVG